MWIVLIIAKTVTVLVAMEALLILYALNASLGLILTILCVILVSNCVQNAKDKEKINVLRVKLNSHSLVENVYVLIKRHYLMSSVLIVLITVKNVTVTIVPLLTILLHANNVRSGFTLKILCATFVLNSVQSVQEEEKINAPLAQTGWILSMDLVLVLQIMFSIKLSVYNVRKIVKHVTVINVLLLPILLHVTVVKITTTYKITNVYSVLLIVKSV